ncbi:hypothetical protein MA20_32050 [Bradyrhizobium japonicum]|uniref:Phage Gp37/Gp68 family protein n=1 Tax=Bradyrhizobium japonicum TaxID=375 RepID=A0A0A3XN34_BRAJP|nr:phage Gp37/Gp68 family protein [Bradyrhizobium japonicum]KGT75822.1 hypothetical protein MA20_32050 [Bradyrhizobium japonicum]
MADRSAIEWTDASWTPVRARNLITGKVGWHCEHATTGCEHCYSEGFNKRLGTGLPFKPGHRKDIEIFLDEQMLTQPLRWKKPRKIFVCSMTDAFADFVTDEMLDRMFAVMAMSPQHTFQVLTKRAKRMRRYLTNADQNEAASVGIRSPGFTVNQRVQALVADYMKLGKFRVNGFGPLYKEDWERAKPNLRPLPLQNVWLGVSAERQPEADERVPELQATPAAVRFVSLEPLLGHISLHALNLATPTPSDALRGVQCVPDGSLEGHHNEQIAKLDWVIVGGESGRDARPMHPDWPRSLRDWCQACDVAYFFKQWGEWAPSTPEEARGNPHSGWQANAAHPHVAKASALYPEAGAKFIARVGKKAAGRLLDGVEHNEFPRVPA